MIYITIAALLFIAWVFITDTGGTQRPWHTPAMKIAIAVAIISFILEIV